MAAPDNNPKSDEDLIAGLRRGEADCGEALSRRYWPAIQRFCQSYLDDDALAEDVTQETFTKLTGGDILPEGAVKPWLYKVARNRCLDILRRHQRSPTHHHRIKTGFDAARDTAGPQTRAVREERRELIRQIIADMPEEYRSVLTLKHFEGFSRTEMAEALGVSEATVKGRLVRASEHLRRELLKITKMNP
ncbi:MAG: RNA polymerase sigma factor [Phycisphaerae bacterium]